MAPSRLVAVYQPLHDHGLVVRLHIFALALQLAVLHPLFPTQFQFRVPSDAVVSVREVYPIEHKFVVGWLANVCQLLVPQEPFWPQAVLYEEALLFSEYQLLHVILHISDCTQ